MYVPPLSTRYEERQFMPSTWRECYRSAAASRRETDVYDKHAKILYIARIDLCRKKKKTFWDVDYQDSLGEFVPR